MSVSVNITITSKAGKIEELRSALLANLPQTQEFAGNELVRMLAPADKPNTLLLLEEWADIEDFHAYKAWRQESNSSALKPELIECPPEVVVSDILF